MIVAAIVATIVIALGILAAYISLTYAEMKGYERGLYEAEQIARDVRDGRLSEHDD